MKTDLPAVFWNKRYNCAFWRADHYYFQWHPHDKTVIQSKFRIWRSQWLKNLQIEGAYLQAKIHKIMLQEKEHELGLGCVWIFLHCFFFLLWILSSKAIDTPLWSEKISDSRGNSWLKFHTIHQPSPHATITYIRHTLRVQDWKGKYFLSQLCGWWHSAPVSVPNGVYHSVLFFIEREITPAHQSQSGWGTKSIPMMNKSELKKVRMSSVSAGDKCHLRLLHSCQDLHQSQFTYLLLPFLYFLPPFPKVTQLCTYFLL